MVALVASLTPWTWFILGALLFGLEILAPGGFMLWLGVSAILVGLISFVVDWAWQPQLVAFAVLAIVALVGWLRVGRRLPAAADEPFLNRRSDRLVGRVFTLDKPIVDGSGTVRIDDTVWRISGPDCPSGSRVKVARADGPLLMVDRVDA